MTTFIAFGHKKRTGKDTAARFLCSHLRMGLKGSDIQQHGFADKGKAVCHELYNWAGLKSAQYYEEFPAEKELVLPDLNLTPREIWIGFMSEAVRDNFYDKTWIKYLLHNVKCDVCIIKDMRFPIEADMIHEAGGYIYRIDRDDAPDTSDLADDALLDYQAWDHIFKNNGTLQDLNKQMEDLAHALIMHIKKEKVA